MEAAAYVRWEESWLVTHERQFDEIFGGSGVEDGSDGSRNTRTVVVKHLCLDVVDASGVHGKSRRASAGRWLNG